MAYDPENPEEMIAYVENTMGQTCHFDGKQWGIKILDHDADDYRFKEGDEESVAEVKKDKYAHNAVRKERLENVRAKLRGECGKAKPETSSGSVSVSAAASTTAREDEGEEQQHEEDDSDDGQKHHDFLVVPSVAYKATGSGSAYSSIILQVLCSRQHEGWIKCALCRRRCEEMAAGICY